MANPTGLLQYPRVEVDHRPIAGAHPGLARDRPAAGRSRAQRAGRPLHGLRHSVSAMPSVARCGTGFPSSTTWCTATAGGRRPTICTRRTTFPEITGRVCPAPCEAACTLALQRSGGQHQADRVPDRRAGVCRGLGRALAAEGQDRPARWPIVGSGPAGLAAAQQLARAGHDVVCSRRTTGSAACLRYGIPDFKLEKHILDRRLEQMVAEGVKFEPNVDVGVDIYGRRAAAIGSTPSCCAWGPASRGICACRAAICRAFISPWTSPQQNRRVARRRRR